MISFFAEIFGYLLNLVYNIIGNYGIAIIVFSIIIKLIMLPLSIKQQKTMEKNKKIQVKYKEIQFKYRNDPEKLNTEMLNLYKNENMSPFSGCFSSIVQLILLLSIFYLVRSPLTYMKKMDKEVINKYETIVKEEGYSTQSGYPEIEIIREIGKIQDLANNQNEQDKTAEEQENSQQPEEKNEQEEQSTEQTKTYSREDIKQEELEQMKINMNFLGLDLSQVPTQNMTDWKVYIIPVLYVIMSFVTMRITVKTPEQEQKKLASGEKDEEEKVLEQDPMEQMNKSMSVIYPIMYVSVALIAPLGLALYWLVNNILGLIEKLILNKTLNKNKEA